MKTITEMARDGSLDHRLEEIVGKNPTPSDFEQVFQNASEREQKLIVQACRQRTTIAEMQLAAIEALGAHLRGVR